MTAIVKVSLSNADKQRLDKGARKVNTQSDRLARRYVIAGLNADQPVVPGGDPPTPTPDTGGEWIGGPVGRGGKSRVVKGETLTRTLPNGIHDTDFYQCKAKGVHLIPERPGPNLRIIDCDIDDMQPTEHGHGMYANVGLEPFPLNFVFQHNRCTRWKVSRKAEMKASYYAFLDNTFEDCTGLGVRHRHGEQALIANNARIGSISVRDNHNAIFNNGGGVMTAWAGKWPGGYEEWKKLRKPGAGDNYFAAVDNFLASGKGNQEPQIGVPSGREGQYRQAVALRNCLSLADKGHAKLMFEKETWFAEQSAWEAQRRERFREMAIRTLTLQEMLALPEDDRDPDDYDEEDIAHLTRMIALAHEERARVGV